MNESYMPSRRIIIFGAVIFCLLAAAVAFKYYPSSISSSAQPLAVSATESGASTTSTKSTPESRARSNTNLSSSGTTTFDTLGTSSASVPTLPDGRENKTQRRLARLAPKIAQLSQSGNYTQEELNAALQKLLTANQDRPKESFTRSDINIQPGTEKNYTSAKNARAYTGSIAKLVQSKQDSGVGKELQILAEGMTNENPEKLRKLESVQQAYSQMVSTMKKMAVPAEFVPAHLKLLNGFAAKRRALKNMRYYLSDPLRGQTAITLYREADRKTTLARKTITKLASLRAQ